MNYPTLKIEYLRDSKDSVFFDSVQRGDIATSAQIQPHASNNKRSHSDLEDRFNSDKDCVFCKRMHLPFKGHTNKNCQAKSAYLKLKYGDNIPEQKKYNQDRDTTQSGQTYNKPTQIPAPGQQKSQYQSQNKSLAVQNKYSKPTYNNNRGTFKPKVNFADDNQNMDEDTSELQDNNNYDEEANSAFMFSNQRVCTKCFDKDHLTQNHDTIIKLRKAIYEKSNTKTKRQCKAILPSIPCWADSSTGITQDTYANLAQDYRSEPPVDDSR